MAKTFMQMVTEAREGIPVISASEAQKRLADDPDTLMIDVRDAADLHGTGVIPGAVNISVGMLPVRADQELPEQVRDPRLQDRSRPVITTCTKGALASLGARTLKEMGFTNVSILEGGTNSWKEAGLPTVEPESA